MRRGYFDQPFFFPRLATMMQRVFLYQAQYRTSIQHNTPLRYAIAIVAVFVAAIVHNALQPYVGAIFPLPVFLLAIFISGWYGGLGPGIFATIAGVLIGTHFFVQPLNTWPLPAATRIQMAFFVGEGILLSILNEALFSAHQIITSTFESITDGFVSLDPKHRLLYMNPEAEKFIGRPADHLGGKDFFEELPEFQDAIFAQHYQAAIETGKPVTFETFYGERHRWVEISLYPGPVGVSIYFHDITARKVAEQESQRNFYLFNAVLESTHDAVSVKDRRGNYLFVNEAGAQLLRRLVEEIVGRSDSALVTSNRRAHIMATDQRVLSTGRPLTYEESIHTIEGAKTYTITKTPLHDYQRKTVGVITICHDISELKDKDRRKDEFISMASHELKTPITSLKVFLDVLRLRLKPLETKDVSNYISKMDIQISKLSKLINELLDLSRIETGKLVFIFEPFDLVALLAETVEIMQATTKHSLQLTGQLTQPVRGDRDRIGQVIINLITNAVKYSPDTSEIHISASRQGNMAAVAVQDFGIGIDPAVHDKIFQRFYQVVDSSTKTYPGLGMGLYISAQIIKRHGGTLSVHSSKGHGATFTFTLPLA